MAAFNSESVHHWEKEMAVAVKDGDKVTLKLSAEEAATIMYVVGCVSGDPEETRRKHTTRVYSALKQVGVRDLWTSNGNGYDLFEEGQPSMRFREGSLDA